MRRNSLVARKAILVTTYVEFREFARAFADGSLGLIVVIGPPGVGKSEIIGRAMREKGGKWGSIKGKLAPLGFYGSIHRHRLDPLVFDDVDGLVKSPDNVTLLKALCETRSPKRIAWTSEHAAFRGDVALPRSFDAIGNVAIITNEWSTVGQNIGALEDRGTVINFAPPALEVHQEVARGGWFDDPEVFGFVGEHLHLISQPSIRVYLVAKEQKSAGLNWRDLFLRALGSSLDGRTVLVARLLADPKYESEAARVDEFVRLSGRSRETYYRRKRKLVDLRASLAGDPSDIQLGPPRRDPASVAAKERRELLEELRGSDGQDDDVPTADPPRAKRDPSGRLRRDIHRAVAKEDYERAAKLRDELRRLEGRDGAAG
jgi:hypothetical protein